MQLKVVFAVTALTAISQVTGQQGSQQGRGGSDKETNDTLIWTIPTVVITAVLSVITVVIIYTVYRQKKYGAFCCLMPKSRYRITQEDSEAASDMEYPSPPPSYSLSNSHTLAPPAYCDALHDVVLDTGDSTTEIGSRYTTWSNVHTNALPNAAPPPANTPQPATHSSSAMHHTPNTEGASTARIEENRTDSCSIEGSDTASTTDSVNSLSYTTITTSSLNLVSVDKNDSGQQLPAAKMINTPPTSNNEAERHRLSNCSVNNF